jgi:hypothetical protein
VTIKKPIADFGGVAVTQNESGYTAAAMPAYTTLICEM